MNNLHCLHLVKKIFSRKNSYTGERKKCSSIAFWCVWTRAIALGYHGSGNLVIKILSLLKQILSFKYG